MVASRSWALDFGSYLITTAIFLSIPSTVFITVFMFIRYNRL